MDRHASKMLVEGDKREKEKKKQLFNFLEPPITNKINSHDVFQFFPGFFTPGPLFIQFWRYNFFDLFFISSIISIRTFILYKTTLFYAIIQQMTQKV